jgi:hypothetical protein
MSLNVELSDGAETFTIVGAQHDGFDLSSMLITFSSNGGNKWILIGEHRYLSTEAAIKAHFFSDGKPKIVNMKPIYFMSPNGNSGMYTDIYGNDRVFQRVADKWLTSHTRNHMDVTYH